MPKNNDQTNSFQQNVENTPDLTGAYCPGLQALGGYSNKVLATDTRKINGSVDIDGATQGHYPNANRWDYAVGYDNKVYFVEVHPAGTSEVKKVVAKLQWLKQWLRDRAPQLNSKKNERPYFWIPVKGNHILPTSSQFRQLAENGLTVCSTLSLR